MDKINDPKVLRISSNDWSLYQKLLHPLGSNPDHSRCRVLKLRLELKKVLANMTSCIHIGLAPPMVTKVDPIPQAKQQILNLDPDNQKEKEHIFIRTPDKDHICVHTHLLYANDWSSTTFMKPKEKDIKRRATKKLSHDTCLISQPWTRTQTRMGVPSLTPTMKRPQLSSAKCY